MLTVNDIKPGDELITIAPIQSLSTQYDKLIPGKSDIFPIGTKFLVVKNTSTDTMDKNFRFIQIILNNKAIPNPIGKNKALSIDNDELEYMEKL